jgi:hypothetical protein
MSDQPGDHWWSLTLNDRSGQGYGQDMFRYFLGRDRTSAVRSGRCVVLILVSLRKHGGRDVISPAAAGLLFCGVGQCLREIDFMGWYRADRVIGAVLIQDVERLAPEVARNIRRRVSDVLRRAVPADITGRVRIRVVQLRPTK